MPRIDLQRRLYIDGKRFHFMHSSQSPSSVFLFDYFISDSLNIVDNFWAAARCACVIAQTPRVSEETIVVLRIERRYAGVAR